MKRIISSIKAGFSDKALNILIKQDRYLTINEMRRIRDVAFYSDSDQIYRWLNEKSIMRFELKELRSREMSDQSRFLIACKEGFVNIVKMFINSNIDDKNVDISFANNLPIKFANDRGHTEIVKILLSDPRVDFMTPHEKRYGSMIKPLENMLFKIACFNGHLEIVRMLCDRKNVDPSSDSNYAIKCASEGGFVEIVRLLLSDKRVDPYANLNYAIRKAHKHGHVEVTQILASC